MTAPRIIGRGLRLTLVSASLVLVTAVLPSAAAATPTYIGNASAGWGYQEGDVLTANPGTWTSNTSITYSYAWFNENSTPLGTGPTHTVVGSDVGHQIYAAITASDGVPPSVTVNTPTVGPMRYRPPVNVEKPEIRGALLVGSTLTATAGKWVSGGASTAPIQIGYAWYRGCTIGPKPDCSNTGFIGDASSVALSDVDAGRVISVSVTASYPDGAGGSAANSVWLGNLGPVVSSSVRAGDTLTGTVVWNVSAPGAQSIAILANGGQVDVLPADASGATTFLFDTTKLPNGSNSLALSVTWSDGAAPTTLQLGTVTVVNAATPVAVRPVIGKPATVPRRPVAGKRFVVTFAVTRSDTHQPLKSGKMVCDPSVKGKVIAHTESFRDGKARVAFTLPTAAGHKLLKVKLTIALGSQSTTRVVSFLVT